ncbi:MAG: indolepyruvate ferredoxin oxidoreductase subunit alpha [Desulfobacterales bacterium]|nr:indolepyruvate ferredoxin oxidoreductase subunit alpha [Desulfobacterales bacterium]MDD4394021.1 indolepyruvate ferredoxin oxidoreductase subunit alpha [Desulfobacterales bacterium]
MHRLLTDKSGQKMLLLGNEAIARGAVEAGVGVSTTYPGTPSSEITLNFFQISRETDLYFEYSTNEKVALEVAAATANSGVRSMCVMKHVGMNVAADPLMTLAYVGVKGGLVIVTADDPAMFSSQNEQDNRYYGKFSGLPVLEPSSVQEAKDMTAYAFELSEMLQEPVILRTTTRLNHATGVVELGKINAPVVQGDFVRDPMNYVTVPAVSKKLHARLLTRLEKAKQISERCVWNFTQGSGAWGIVCNGVSYNYVSDAVSDLGIEAKVKVFRIGLSHPLPEATIKQFLKKCEKVLVVEEGEPLMEETIKAFAQEEKLPLTIAGKGENLFSRLYEYDPALVRKTIATFFDVAYEPAAPVDLSGIPELPQRPPNLCAGCSHRATFHAIKKAAEGMDIICPNDIGCYTLGFLPPLSMGDFLICMGSSIGTACGFSRVTGKKVIAVIGDSTFFHSGMAGLVNAVFNNHNFTLVILDNETTAMTGHQPNPGVDMKNLNMNGYGRVSIENIVRAIGVPHVSVIRPYHVRKSVETIKAALDFQGVSVIISREMCHLYARSIKKPGRGAFYVSEKCRNHRTCINELGCPAFSVTDGRVVIDPVMCTGCSVCAQICPEHAILPLKK